MDRGRCAQGHRGNRRVSRTARTLRPRALAFAGGSDDWSLRMPPVLPKSACGVRDGGGRSVNNRSAISPPLPLRAAPLCAPRTVTSMVSPREPLHTPGLSLRQWALPEPLSLRFGDPGRPPKPDRRISNARSGASAGARARSRSRSAPARQGRRRRPRSHSPGRRAIVRAPWPAHPGAGRPFFR